MGMIHAAPKNRASTTSRRGALDTLAVAAGARHWATTRAVRAISPSEAVRASKRPRLARTAIARGAIARRPQASMYR